MDMNAIDIGTLLAIAGLLYKTTQDKIAQAEEMGKLKQQVKSLETKTNQIDNKLGEIDEKLGSLLQVITKVETLVEQSHKYN
jgi:septal ring factor EnvC (AmiA/AmiB activator)